MHRIHELKDDPFTFNATASGLKSYEIRFNDRNYRVGDYLILKETKFSGEEMRNGKPLEYTGRQVTRVITHILTGYGLKERWVILSVLPV